MQVSRRVDYGIRAMIDVASRAPNSIVATREVAEHQEIPQVFLTKIVSRLTRAGLLGTTRGATGGIYLARPAQDIRILDIVEAVDGPIAINRCTHQPSQCKRDPLCPSRPLWQKIQDEMLGTLREARLSEVAGRTGRGDGEARPSLSGDPLSTRR